MNKDAHFDIILKGSLIKEVSYSSTSSITMHNTVRLSKIVLSLSFKLLKTELSWEWMFSSTSCENNGDSLSSINCDTHLANDNW